MSERAFSCGLYLAGHDVHWIQSKLSLKVDAARPRPGRIEEVHPDGVLVVRVESARYSFWNHDPRRLHRLVAANHGLVTYQREFNLLRTRSGPGSHFVFCVIDAADPGRRPCGSGFYGPPPLEERLVGGEISR